MKLSNDPALKNLSDNLRGSLYMTGSMAGFVSSDAIMKSVSDELSLYQAICLRGLLATALLGMMAWHQGAFRSMPRGRDLWITIVRTLADLAAAICFLTALFKIELGQIAAIVQAAPLAMTLAGAWFLGHHVGWRRYAAIVIGFAGVLLIVKPGAAGFSVYSVWALASVAFVVLRDLVTRGLSPQTPTLIVALFASAGVTVTGIAMSLASDWPADLLGPVTALFFCAVLLVFGLIFAVAAMRVGEVAVTSPFRYTAIIFAVILGYLFFDEVPDFWAIIGSLIVVATGIFTFYRERVLARRTD